MVYVGVGGDIDGVINPRLTASEGSIVQITGAARLCSRPAVISDVSADYTAPRASALTSRGFLHSGARGHRSFTPDALSSTIYCRPSSQWIGCAITSWIGPPSIRKSLT